MKSQYLKFILDRYVIGKIILKLNINNFYEYNNKSKKYIHNLLKIMKKYNVNNIKNSDINNAIMIYINRNLISEPSEFKVKLQDSIDDLIENMILFDNYDRFCILKLSNKLKRYKRAYKDWKIFDKFKSVNYLGNIYNDIDNMINLKKEDIECINVIEDIHNLEQTQHDILTEIKNLDGLDIFKNKVVEDLNLDKEQIDKSYWQLLESELLHYPIRLTFICKLLEELKLIIYKLIPNRLDKLILVEQEVNLSKNIDTQYILLCINFFFEFVQDLQSMNDDDETKIHFKIFKSHLIEGTELHYFLPKSLKYLIQLYNKILFDKTQIMKIMKTTK